MSESTTVAISVESIGVGELVRFFEKNEMMIANAVRAAARYNPGYVPPPKQWSKPGHFHVGKEQLGAGYAFRFSADKDSPPYISSKQQIVEAGSEWMRLHAPRQWAAFCAARLTGSHDVAIVSEDGPDAVLCPVYLKPRR